ncbi:long-chain fatty acid--CoA ligase [Sphingomonas sp. HMP9]|nr:long-chain fatty acid--CoA ligase [Sphingomonas sp. HMP9]
MRGLMQDRPLTTGLLIDHAAINHGAVEIVSRAADGAIERSTWGRVATRARRVAAALEALGARRGDRIATLAWNRTAHLELYYGVTASGLVLHTVNPRLFAEQISYILGHGGARILCVDPDLLPIIEPLVAGLPDVPTIIVLSAKADMPASDLPGLIAYETLIADTAPLPAWPAIEESAASTLCYTSGTTGNPKGVLYSHRSTLLHAFAACAADSMALSARDSVLLVTPLFHVNAWGCRSRRRCAARSSCCRVRRLIRCRSMRCCATRVSASRSACPPSGSRCSITSQRCPLGTAPR